MAVAARGRDKLEPRLLGLMESQGVSPEHMDKLGEAGGHHSGDHQLRGGGSTLFQRVHREGAPGNQEHHGHGDHQPGEGYRGL